MSSFDAARPASVAAQSSSADQGLPASRREFLQSSSALAAAAGLGHALPKTTPRVHSSGSDILRVGLVGCGGRGTQAAIEACQADEGVRIVALADAFEDRVQQCLRLLQRAIPDRVEVTSENCFTDFDCFQRLIGSGIDVVLLCSPPHFRPAEIEAAVAAGKHVFCEKPIAVDAPGVRKVIAACESAREKGLSIVSGLCWRYDVTANEVIQRMGDGAIGDIVAIHSNYLTQTLWHRGDNPDWSRMEYQLRNWLYFDWLSGDHIVEQQIHSVDRCLWALGDQPPVSCHGIGGRQVRTGEQWGNIYDHFTVCYEWENGVKAFLFTRQMDHCFNETEDYVLGTTGQARIIRGVIDSPNNEWRFRGPKPSMYLVEHQVLFDSIRKSLAINNGDYMTKSTLMSIMGRQACYTGQVVRWEEMLADTQTLGPAAYTWGDIETAPVPNPRA